MAGTVGIGQTALARRHDAHPAVRRQKRFQRRDDLERRPGVGRHQAVEILGGGVGDGRRRVGHAGVDEQPVEPFALQARFQSRNLLGPGDVGGLDPQGVIAGRQIVQRRGLLGGANGGHDPQAPLKEGLGKSKAKTA